MNRLKNQVSDDDYKKLSSEDRKFLKTTGLLINYYPSNGVIKDIKEEIFQNLILNILDDKGRVINSDLLKSYFWSYFKKNKKICVFDVFGKLEVNVGDSKMNLKDFIVVLNSIMDQTTNILSELKDIKKSFEQNEEQINSQGQISMDYDNWYPKYNGFLKKRIDQFKVEFNSQNFLPRNILFYFFCKHKSNKHDFIEKDNYNIVDLSGLKISVKQYMYILNMLDFEKNLELTKKI